MEKRSECLTRFYSVHEKMDSLLSNTDIARWACAAGYVEKLQPQSFQLARVEIFRFVKQLLEASIHILSDVNSHFILLSCVDAAMQMIQRRTAKEVLRLPRVYLDKKALVPYCQQQFTHSELVELKKAGKLWTGEFDEEDNMDIYYTRLRDAKEDGVSNDDDDTTFKIDEDTNLTLESSNSRSSLGSDYSDLDKLDENVKSAIKAKLEMEFKTAQQLSMTPVKFDVITKTNQNNKRKENISTIESSSSNKQECIVDVIDPEKVKSQWEESCSLCSEKTIKAIVDYVLEEEGNACYYVTKDSFDAIKMLTERYAVDVLFSIDPFNVLGYELKERLRLAEESNKNLRAQLLQLKQVHVRHTPEDYTEKMPTENSDKTLAKTISLSGKRRRVN